MALSRTALAASLVVLSGLAAAPALAQDQGSGPPYPTVSSVWPAPHAPQAHDAERPPADAPASRVDDTFLVGASAAVGGAMFDRGPAQGFTFALRLGGPHYGHRDAPPRTFAVDLGLQATSGSGWHGTAFSIDVRDFERFTTFASAYELLGMSFGDFATPARDDFAFTGSIGGGLELAPFASFAIDVEVRVLARMLNDDGGNLGAELGAQATAGITVYLGA